ncbi:hypothetical protein [Candidatus Tisiphia endosymbiont of Nemotelus uliginosus]|uniref:hypothetical protein n=1 Tax=Candidatus Tisiphia endosymbiont of Nemotelus uliginosus TaxID=3077926 RepID=UPI0035C8DE55
MEDINSWHTKLEPCYYSDRLLNKLIQLLWSQKKYNVLLIKLFDRFHNMQTLDFQSAEQIRKVVKEYFASFITLSMYFRNKIPKMLQIEEEMYRLCYQNLSL